MVEDLIFVLDCGYTETTFERRITTTVCFYLIRTFFTDKLKPPIFSSILVFFHFLKRLGEQLPLPL